MTDQTEHDNSWLRPYLQAIKDAGSDGMEKAATDEAFARIFAQNNEGDAEFQGAGKIRQTMYIAKLAKGIGNTVYLTTAGLEYLDGT